MAKNGAACIAALGRKLGHDFNDPHLLLRALTHPSAATDPTSSYQRLEFLGDRVLALVIAGLLMKAFPDAPEGELARRLTGLVRNETCADVARDLDLGAEIQLGPGEAQSGGRNKAAILGDVCEAVIGAIYADAGLEPAARFIEANWRRRMMGLRGSLRDAKTTLQEWAQGQGRDAPSYTIVSRTGPDHAPRFEVEAVVEGVAPSRGSGSSRREAEQRAAAAVLSKEGLWSVDGDAG